MSITSTFLEGIPQSVNLLLYKHEYTKRFPDREFAILMQKRDTKTDVYPGTYSIPGGHVEHGETVFEAAVREIEEELQQAKTGEGLRLDPKTFSYLGAFDAAELGFNLVKPPSDVEKAKGWQWTLAKWCKIRHAIAAPLPMGFDIKDYNVTEGVGMEFVTRDQIRALDAQGMLFPMDRPYLLRLLGLS
ncbi:NUDIX hydrolase [Candidatus Woesearchaeota archaeon]|nr:NUDIX hydrolase [Candidatus Woesearchaeota archaeon]